MMGGMDNDDDNDEDLEAELMALTSGTAPSRPKKGDFCRNKDRSFK